MAQNPGRVPTPIANSEPQAGAVRIIHPIGSPALRVGRAQEHGMDRPELYHTVKESVVAEHRNGRSRMKFAEGTRVPKATAYDYGLIDEPAVAGTARPESEKPATAESDEPVRFRSEDAAPENRMEPAPQMPERGSGSAPENREELTPQQKAARTRAANQAAREAESTAPQSDEPAGTNDVAGDESGE